MTARRHPFPARAALIAELLTGRTLATVAAEAGMTTTRARALANGHATWTATDYGAARWQARRDDPDAVAADRTRCLIWAKNTPTEARTIAAALALTPYEAFALAGDGKDTNARRRVIVEPTA